MDYIGTRGWDPYVTCNIYYIITIQRFAAAVVCHGLALTLQGNKGINVQFF